jgi:membrane protease YdiL (CAAX protease family)
VEWWQVVLILLASIVIGVVVGAILSYLFLKFVKNRKAAFFGNLNLRSVTKPEVISVAEEPLQLITADLLAEIEHNRKIAIRPLADKLPLFQTDAWGIHRYQVAKLPANLQDELAQVYIDIHFANSLVSVSTEFGRRTPDLDENYRRLCASIAESLGRMKPLIEHHTYTGQLAKPNRALSTIITIKPRIEPMSAEAIIYLLGIAAAQAITAFHVPLWGILCHIALLIVIIVRSALADQNLHQRLLLSLALVPLLGIISMGMPLTDIPPILSYHLSYAPLLVAVVLVVAILGYTPEQVGFSLRRFPIQLVVGLTGIVFGVAEYFVLTPEPMLAELTLQKVWLPALILLVSAGFMEEFTFRGVVQTSSTQAFGEWGIVYVSLLFAVTHIGFVPVIDLVFVFVVALFFGWVVRKTGSILGVALSRGLCNIALYLIVPFFF